MTYEEYKTKQDREDETYDNGEKWHTTKVKHSMIKAGENDKERLTDDIEALK